MNQKLSEPYSDAAWRASPPVGKGRTKAGIATAHRQCAADVAGGRRQVGENSRQAPTIRRLRRPKCWKRSRDSAKRLNNLRQKDLQNVDGQVTNFKPDVLAFGGYLIAHDSHRRGQISVLAHQMDMPAPSKASYGPWEWGTLWKECER
jgi:hypothetical protein